MDPADAFGAEDLHCFFNSPSDFVDQGGNLAVLDVNGDTRVDLSDAVAVLNYLFRGSAPPALGTECLRIEGCPDACGA